MPDKKKVEAANKLELLKGVPYLGMAIGVANYFLLKENKVDEPVTPPITFNATVDISGSIIDKATLDPKLIEVPGSDYNSSNVSTIPMYDEPLGVVSLVKTPKIEFKHHVAGTYDDDGNFIENHPLWEKLPMTTTFTIKDPLEIAMNPSSELEVVEIKVANVLEYVPFNELKEFQNRLDIGPPSHPHAGSNFLNYPYNPGATMSIKHWKLLTHK